MTYLERYLNGEYEQVWAELLALDGQIREEPLYSDALAVAHETMSRVKHNIELLKQRLYELNYKFVADDPHWGGALEQYFQQMDTAATIARLENIGLTLPLSLKVFYEIVGRVDFRGSHPRLSEYSGFYDDYTELAVDYSDPMVVWPPDEQDLEEYLDASEDEEITTNSYYAEIAPDEVHKANVSGGSPYSILLGEQTIDGVLTGDRGYGTFVEYLRLCFCWGGFPGFKRSNNLPAEELAYLTKDLLPI